MNRRSIANGFNILGYCSLGLQWLWLLIQYMPWLLASVPSSFLSPPPPAPITETPEVLSPLVIIFVIVIAAFVVGLGLYAMVRLPGQATKVADRSTKNLSDLATRRLAAQKPISSRQRLVLGRRLQLAVKLGLATLALASLLSVNWQSQAALDFDIVMMVGVLLWPWSVVWFLTAYWLRPR